MAAEVKEVVMVSCRGGTGKTSIVAGLAGVAKGVLLADYAVCSGNLPGLLPGTLQECGSVFDGYTVSADMAKCKQCGLCSDLCRVKAMEKGVVLRQILCDGCGLCADYCPRQVLQLQPRRTGEWWLMQTGKGPMVIANLDLMSDNYSRLVVEVKRVTRKFSRILSLPLILADGPGSIDQTFAAIQESALAVMVTEPSPAALHDANEMLILTRRLQIPLCLCINKSDLNDSISRQIRAWGLVNQIPVVGEIPFRDEFRLALRAERSVMEGSDRLVKGRLDKLWSNLESMLARRECNDNGRECSENRDFCP